MKETERRRDRRRCARMIIGGAAIMLAVALVWPGTLQASEAQMVIRDAATGDAVTVPLRNIAGTPCFPLRRFADYMGLELDWDYVDGTIRIEFRDHVVRFAGGGSVYSFDGVPGSLPSAVVQTAEEIWMPLAFLEDPGGRLWEGDVVWNPKRRELLVSALQETGQAPEAAPAGDGDFIVVLDPGHGGRDPGCRLPDGTLEKDLTVSLCRRLANLLEDRLGIEAVLTRSGDYDVDIPARTVMANTRRADLFLSIHFAPASTVEDSAFCVYRNVGNTSKYTMKSALLVWEDQEAGVPDRVTRMVGVLGQALSETCGNRNWVTRVADVLVLKGLAVPGMMVEISDDAAFYGNEPVTGRTGLGRAAEALFDAVKRIREGE